MASGLKSCWFAHALAAAALALPCHSVAGDFIFGEDFDGIPPCPSFDIFSMIGTPSMRTGSLGTSQYFLIKLRACNNVSGLVTLSQDGAPDSWARTLDAEGLTLAAGAYAVTLLSVDVPPNGATGLGTFNLYAWHNGDLTFSQVKLYIGNP